MLCERCNSPMIPDKSESLICGDCIMQQEAVIQHLLFIEWLDEILWSHPF